MEKTSVKNTEPPQFQLHQKSRNSQFQVLVIKIGINSLFIRMKLQKRRILNHLIGNITFNEYNSVVRIPLENWLKEDSSCIFLPYLRQWIECHPIKEN